MHKRTNLNFLLTIIFYKQKQVLSTENTSPKIELSPEKSRKKKRRLFKSRTYEESPVLQATNSKKRPIVVLSQKEDSVQNLHLFLENRAAKLALEEREKVREKVILIYTFC